MRLLIAKLVEVSILASLSTGFTVQVENGAFGEVLARAAFSQQEVSVVSSLSAAPNSVGTFTDGPFGIGNGVILTTGLATGALPQGNREVDNGYRNDGSFDSYCGPDSMNPVLFTIGADISLVAGAKGVRIDFIFATNEPNSFRGAPDSIGILYPYYQGKQFASDKTGNRITAMSSYTRAPNTIFPPNSVTGYARSTPPLFITIPTPTAAGIIYLYFSVCDIGDGFQDSAFLFKATTCTDCDLTPNGAEINYVKQTSTLKSGEQPYTSTIPASGTQSGTYIVFVEPEPATTTTTEEETTTGITTTVDATTTVEDTTTTTEEATTIDTTTIADSTTTASEITPTTTTTEEVTTIDTTTTADVTTTAVEATTPATVEVTTIDTSTAGDTTTTELTTATEDEITTTETREMTTTDTTTTTDTIVTHETNTVYPTSTTEPTTLVISDKETATERTTSAGTSSVAEEATTTELTSTTEDEDSATTTQEISTTDITTATDSTANTESFTTSGEVAGNPGTTSTIVDNVSDSSTADTTSKTEDIVTLGTTTSMDSETATIPDIETTAATDAQTTSTSEDQITTSVDPVSINTVDMETTTITDAVMSPTTSMETTGTEYSATFTKDTTSRDAVTTTTGFTQLESTNEIPSSKATNSSNEPTSTIDTPTPSDIESTTTFTNGVSPQSSITTINGIRESDTTAISERASSTSAQTAPNPLEQSTSTLTSSTVTSVDGEPVVNTIATTSVSSDTSRIAGGPEGISLSSTIFALVTETMTESSMILTTLLSSEEPSDTSRISSFSNGVLRSSTLPPVLTDSVTADLSSPPTTVASTDESKTSPFVLAPDTTTDTPPNSFTSIQACLPSGTIPPANDLSNLPKIQEYQYLGCLRSTQGFPSFRLISSGANMTTTSCITLARGRAYVGVHDRSCYAASNLNSASLIGNESCDLVCPGDKRYACGGPAASSSLCRFSGPRRSLQRRDASPDIFMTLYGLRDVESQPVDDPETTAGVFPAVPHSTFVQSGLRSTSPGQGGFETTTRDVPSAPDASVTREGPNSASAEKSPLSISTSRAGHAASGLMSQTSLEPAKIHYATTVTTITYTIPDPSDPSYFIRTEYCATLSYEPCTLCGQQPIPTVEMTTRVVSCDTCGEYGEDLFTITAPCAALIEPSTNGTAYDGAYDTTTHELKPHRSDSLLEFNSPTELRNHAVSGSIQDTIATVVDSSPTAHVSQDNHQDGYGNYAAPMSDKSPGKEHHTAHDEQDTHVDNSYTKPSHHSEDVEAEKPGSQPTIDEKQSTPSYPGAAPTLHHSHGYPVVVVASGYQNRMDSVLPLVLALIGLLSLLV
ncbi:hypothetical protein FGRMN_5651 [Fusarium graminum]|nr:hypothetical protein FGRMN_5651 [Fusarium graminum]